MATSRTETETAHPVDNEAPRPDMSKTTVDTTLAWYGNSKGKPYRLQLRDERMIYRRLMDHLTDMEAKSWKWRCKYTLRGVALLVFSGLVAALVCSLTVEPTNRKRLLHLRIWQWVTMAMMLFAVFSVVPVLTLVASWPFKLVFRTNKYWVYFLRRLKRSVDVTLWACLVLLGWYAWFRPRLKHVYGDVSVVACQQTTRFLIALCIGAALWTLKNALYLKLKADLHYDQLFDRITQTVGYLNGYEILKGESHEMADFLAYDDESIADFTKYAEEKDWRKKMRLLARYVMRRKSKIWFRSSCDNNSNSNSNTRTDGTPKARIRNIWVDVIRMKRESVPIWIVVRLVREYLDRVKVLRKQNRSLDGLVDDDHQLLESAKQMFKDITGMGEHQDINQFHEIKENDLKKYKLSKEGLDYIFNVKQHQMGENINKILNPPTEEINDTQPQEGTSTITQQQQQQQHSSIPKQEIQSETQSRALQVDDFLQWAVRMHKNCWGLERTLVSSKTAFKKLDRMLSAFLLVLVAIIWLLLSKIVTTSQLALLFAPFLAASFMFENSSKNMLNGIIFAFAMHPFDVGDRVIIEDIQMRVKELNILTSVFYKYDTGAEVIFPNSKLATSKIVNLDITPDQSDKLAFIIRSTAPIPKGDATSEPPTPLENIKDLELKIQKFLDDDLYYASGTKVVKNGIQNPESPLELHMIVHFKYLVSYLPTQKKAERRSEILSTIMKFRKEMETIENIKEYPLDYKPYDLELTTAKRVKLSDIERVKHQILTSMQTMGYQSCKVVLTNLEHKKVMMALYVTKSEESKEELKADDVIEELKLLDENFLQDYGFTDMKVSRGQKTIYQRKWKFLGPIIKARVQSLRHDSMKNATTKTT